ncbi:MAG: sulfotransferase family 2 domain-containing protein [Pseudomonadota bacterium]
MIISHGRRYIFVHIPKTGGTSLARALEDRAMKDDLLVGDTPKALRRRQRLKNLHTRGRLWKHSTLADIDGILQPVDIQELFVFTLVRNPWDRVVSYYFWLRAQTFDHPDVHCAKRSDFQTFLADRGVQSRLSLSPARHYMTDYTGREHQAHYLRLEHLDVDAAPLWDHLGFRLEVPHDNRSDRPADHRTCYTQATQALVGRLCAEDIARFGYTFDTVGKP